ncbi:MAG: hypothetical protein U9O55_02030 [Patescibacteria group bacterium]|nr:hypothetical protein [Patescibacteria group bacterium]
MKNLNAIETVEKVIKDKTGFLKKWQIFVWINEKIRLGEFDNLIKKLPLGLILSLRGGIKENRCVLFLITNSEYIRVSEGIKTRHPKKTHFPLKEMPPPISAVLKKGNVYITDPATNPLTEYMVKLVYNEKINAIYYTNVKTPRGDYILVVDATDKKRTFNDDEKLFIDTIGHEIAEMEKEKERKEEKSKEIISFLLGLLIHLFRNKIQAIGGLSRLMEIASSKKSNGECQKCREKTAAILSEASKIEGTINLLQEALHDIKMAEEFNLEPLSFRNIIKPLIATNIQTIIIVDSRKVEKFLERIPPPSNISITEEDKYIRVSFPLEDEEMWRSALSMRSQTKIKNNYFEKSFLLLVSIMLFKATGGKVKLSKGFINIFFKRG